MTRHEFLYLKLMEECAEVAQRASKLLQFGSEEVQAGQSLQNSLRLRLELNDLLTIIDMIEQAGFPMNQGEDLDLHMATKRAKVEYFYRYSQELGRVTTGRGELETKTIVRMRHDFFEAQRDEPIIRRAVGFGNNFTEPVAWLAAAMALLEENRRLRQFETTKIQNAPIPGAPEGNPNAD